MFVITAVQQESLLYKVRIEKFDDTTNELLETRYITREYADISDTAQFNPEYHDAILAATIIPYVYDHEHHVTAAIEQIRDNTRDITEQGFTYDGVKFDSTVESRVEWLEIAVDSLFKACQTANVILPTGTEAANIRIRGEGESYTFTNNAKLVLGLRAGINLAKKASVTGAHLEDLVLAATDEAGVESALSQDNIPDRLVIWNNYVNGL